MAAAERPRAAPAARLRGQGPEHSSARLERFLTLAAEDNIQIANPTTAAQYFHLLRRQVVRPWRKPLVVLTPKSLLRFTPAFSPLEDLAGGAFQRILPDPAANPKQTSLILMCSGKIAYDLEKAREEAKRTNVAILRVEQLYPSRTRPSWPHSPPTRLEHSFDGSKRSRKTRAPGATFAYASSNPF